MHPMSFARSLLLFFGLLLLAACGPRQQDVAFGSGGVPLAGTIYWPSGDGPHPAIILIHGSGPDSREQYRFYADMFARAGIATLIYDKRGVGGSGGDWTRSPFSALADDAEAAVAFLRRQPGIDPARVGLWGGSEGAVVAPWVASRSPHVAFVVMQSGTGVTFAEQNLHQTGLQMRALGLPQAEVREALAFQRLKHGYARTGQGWEDYARALQASRSEPWGSLGGPNRPDDWWWAWYRTKMDVDPARFLDRVRVPVFAVWGGGDQLVPVARSRAAVAAALRRAGNDAVTLMVVPEADHSLNMPSGPSPAPAYTDAMLAWLGRVARPGS